MEIDLEGLLRGRRASLVAIARREGLGPEDALEAVQDALCTFVALARPGLDAEHALASLRTMIRNAARNARRRHHRLRVHEPVEPTNEPIDDAAAPDERVLEAERVARLRYCVSELRAPQREALLLRFLDERSGEDVAAQLGLGRAYVDVLVHRARTAVRACLEDERRR